VTTFMAICRTLNVNPYEVDEGARSLVRFGHDGGRNTGATLYAGPGMKLYCMSKKTPEPVEGHGPWTEHRDQRFFQTKPGRLWECSPK